MAVLSPADTDMPGHAPADAEPMVWRVFKVSLIVGVVTAAAMGLLTFMILAKYDDLLNDFTRSRINVIGLEARANIEQELSIGLSLPQAHNTHDVIKRAVQRDPKLTGGFVLDALGDVLYGAPENAVPLSSEAMTLLKKAIAAGKETSFARGNVLTVATPIQNSYRQTVGMVALRYDISALLERRARSIEEFVSEALLFLAVGLAVSLAVVALFLVGYEKALMRFLAYLRDSSASGTGGEETAAFKTVRKDVLGSMAAIENLVKDRA